MIYKVEGQKTTIVYFLKLADEPIFLEKYQTIEVQELILVLSDVQEFIPNSAQMQLLTKLYKRDSIRANKCVL
jgi:hypothetical protein